MNSFEAVNSVYKISNQYDLHFHRLENIGFKNFSTELFWLEMAINRNELSEEFLLNDLVSSFRKYRFYVTAALLPFNQPESLGDKNKLFQLYKRCKLLFPDIHEQLERCYLAFTSIAESDENPLLEYVNEKINLNIYTGILLKGTSNYEVTKLLIESVSSTSKIKLIGSQVLKTNTFLEQLLIIGPSRWYPNYVYNSPHAPIIHSITYKWLEKKYREVPYLNVIGQKEASIFAGRNIIFHDQIPQRDVEEEVILDPSIDRTLDFSYVEKQLRNSFVNASDEEEDIVDAKLVILSGGKRVFFEELYEKNIFSIYSDTDGFSVGKISIHDLEQDSYILIRTGTKQDLIRAKADEIIGKGAQTFRNYNLIWKKRLKKYVSRNSIRLVQSGLAKLGVTNPAETNIRNWLSEETIMPASEKDFKAILKFVKLEENESKHMKVAKVLRRAHIDAGKLIRNKLIEQIKSTDLTVLELKGEHVFTLPDESDVSFTAYRVEYVSDQKFKMHSSNLKEVLRLK